MKEVPYFQSLQSRRFEGSARPGEAWPRPRLQNVLAQDKARLTGTRNYLILLLKSQPGWTWSSWQLCSCWRQTSMQVSNSSVARPWKLEQNPLGQALKGNWSKIKKGPFCGPQNVRKSRRAKMGLPCSSFHLQLLLVKSASTWNKRFKNICHNEGAKNWTLQGGPLLISRGSTFLTAF